jgi:hypothetical protein
MIEPAKHAYWASVKFNDDFYCVNTYSGYRMYRLDYRGRQFLLSSDVSDEDLGRAILDAQQVSRFVAPEARKDEEWPKEVEFDMELFDYDKYNQRYKAWIEELMLFKGYKTKRKLMIYMRSCGVVRRDGVHIFMPTIDDKEHCCAFETNWEGNITLPDTANAREVGETLRLAFSRSE